MTLIVLRRTVYSQRFDRHGDHIREQCHSQTGLCFVCERAASESTHVCTCREHVGTFSLQLHLVVLVEEELNSFA